MTEDWAAVARPINKRAAELGLRQRDLIERSHVSEAIVGEITRNVVQRRRSARTLEALSIALDWHPQHLTAVLHGRRPPAIGEPVYRFDDEDVRHGSRRSSTTCARYPNVSTTCGRLTTGSTR